MTGMDFMAQLGVPRETVEAVLAANLCLALVKARKMQCAWLAESVALGPAAFVAAVRSWLTEHQPALAITAVVIPVCEVERRFTLGSLAPSNN